MSIFTKETSLYEVLIRVRPDKSWTAQYQTITVVKEGDAALTTNVDAVLPLDTQDVVAFDVVSHLIGTAAADHMVAQAVLIDIAEKQGHAIIDLESQAEKQVRVVDDLKSQLEQQAKTISELQSKIADMKKTEAS